MRAPVVTARLLAKSQRSVNLDRLALYQHAVWQRGYVPRKKQWKADPDWWSVVRERYGQDKEPARWAQELGMDKGTLSRKMSGKLPLSAEDAIAISRLLGLAPPRGLLDELHRRAIAALEAARAEGVSEAELAAQVTRLERACASLVQVKREWSEEEGGSSSGVSGPLDESA